MITLRKSSDRGHADHGWLKSCHTFSFADYHDPAHMGFGNLRVINEDRVAPGSGFGTHGHRDMEIVSYVLEGELAHKDSMGTGRTQPPRHHPARRRAAHERRPRRAAQRVQPRPDETTHFLQIWILPNVRGIRSRATSRSISTRRQQARQAAPRRLARRPRRLGDVQRRFDLAALFDGGERIERDLDPKRKAWVQVVRGRVEVNGRALEAGDALGLQGERARDRRRASAEVLVFDLA